MEIVKIISGEPDFDKVFELISEDLKQSEIASNFSEISFSSNSPEFGFLIQREAKEVFERNARSVFIGKDHFSSYNVVKSFLKNESNGFFILFDAHLNCLKNQFIRKLIEEGENCSGFVIVSAREHSSQEIEYAKKNKITFINMDIINEEKEGICDILMERARKSSGFFIIVDADCLDPAFAPGSADLCPGGLYSRELIYFLKRLSLLDNFKGECLTGINPKTDVNNITSKLFSKIISEII